jgi:LAGLIDADG endonuclease
MKYYNLNYYKFTESIKNNITNLNLDKDFTKPRNENLKPWQVTGLTDGEGSFTLSNYVTKTGSTIKLEFKITQKSHSEGILHELKKYFNCGSVVIDNRKTETKKYRVSRLSDIIEKIIPHFDKYPCLTSKFLNYNDWKKIALIIKNKEHLTLIGLEKIKIIMKNMNKKISFEDKYNYCKNSLGIVNGESLFKLPEHWLQAFLDGEGTFYNYLAEKESKGKIYITCDSSLEIGQNNHDIAILLAIKNFFNGGYIKPKYNINDIIECKNSRSLNRFVIRDTKSIIQFIDNYPLLTRKQLDYTDWKKIIELKISGAHKTIEGRELIKKKKLLIWRTLLVILIIQKNKILNFIFINKFYKFY